MTTMKKKALVAAAVLFVIVFVLGACAAETPFRLHIVANSDSDADQQVKIAVRDAVLLATKDGIAQCKNASEAEEYIKENIEIIIETADDTLAQNGFDYRAAATVGTDHFPERTYQGVCYPEGDYEALRVILGDGEGHNWWCVMFPPLCITEIEDEQTEYTSFFAELFKSLFGG